MGGSPTWDLLQGHARPTAWGGQWLRPLLWLHRTQLLPPPSPASFPPPRVVSRSSAHKSPGEQAGVQRTWPRTGSRTTFLVFWRRRQFISNIEKAHKPVSIQPWVAVGGIIIHSIPGMFLALCSTGIPRFIALRFLVLRRYCVFDKLKVRMTLHRQKDYRSLRAPTMVSMF